MFSSKTKFFLLLLLVTCLAFSSCQKPTNNPDKSVVYFFQAKDFILAKTNMVTGITTTLCDDPLCEHGNDCRFSNAHSPYLVGTIVYFYREAGMFIEEDVAFMTTQICSYDYESGKYTVIQEIKHSNKENVCGKFEVYNGNIYFYQQTLVDNRVQFSLRQLNISTNVLTEHNWTTKTWHFSIHNDRLYFSDAVNGIYSTDFELNDQQYLVQPADNQLVYARCLDQNGSLYYIEKGEDKLETLVIYSPKTGNKTVIDSSDSITYVQVVGNAVFYLKATNSTEGKLTQGFTIYEWKDGETQTFYVGEHELISLQVCQNYIIADDIEGNRNVFLVE